MDVGTVAAVDVYRVDAVNAWSGTLQSANTENTQHRVETAQPSKKARNSSVSLDST